MSDFKVQVLPVDSVEPIEGADFIEAAVIYGYRSVVAKGSVRAADAVVYFPEDSVLPEPVLASLGLVGKLDGTGHNRVKAHKFRKTLSQGIVWKPEWINQYKLFDDVTEMTGATKWEQPIPTQMQGLVSSVLRGKLISYDIENIKRYPGMFSFGEPVSFTEKRHGTYMCLSYIPGVQEEVSHFGFAINSKGLGSQGLAFKNIPENSSNLYVTTARKLQLQERLLTAIKSIPFMTDECPVYVMGEIFGEGIQDLTYGVPRGTPEFEIFDIYVGYPGMGRWMDEGEKITFSSNTDIPFVPYLYVGPYTEELVQKHTSGNSIARINQIREGIVIRPTNERYDDEIGRVILKSVSDAYLLRKNGTELN